MDTELLKITQNKLLELIQENKLIRAESIAKEALKVFTDNRNIRQLLSVILIGLKRYLEAEKIVVNLLENNPNASDFNNLSIIYKCLERYDDALEFAKLAVGLNFNNANYFGNLATIYSALNFKDEAHDAIDKSIALSETSDSWFNKGIFYFTSNKLKESVECYKRAIKINPKPEYHIEMFYALAKNKEYQKSWQFNEFRYQTSPQVYNIANKLGLPVLFERKDLYEEKICISFEQGIGDNVMFSRFLDKFHAKAPNSYLLIDGEYATTLFNQIKMPKSREVLPETNYLICMMSLPYHLNTNDVGEFKLFHQHNPIKSKKLKVGIAWAGSAYHPSDPIRSTYLADFLPFLNDSEMQIYSFMKDKRKRKRVNSDEIIDYAEGFETFKIIDFGSQMTSLEETIHLFDEIDLLVSVDTSVVHLAGSAGVPTYLLVDEMCDWRWGSNESVSDWYPSVQIFRKTNGQSYKDLILEVYKKIRSA